MNGNVEYKHGHNQIAAALFVGSLIVGLRPILSAELTKPVPTNTTARVTATNT